MPYIFHLPTLEEMRRPENGGMEMIRIIDNDDFKTSLVTGCPGSGKTTVSVYRLIRLNRQEAGVRFVTYQNMLALTIQQAVTQHHAVAQGRLAEQPRVSTFHKWYCPLTDSSFDTDKPPTVEQMEALLSGSNLARNGQTELIIDEGQDLPLCVYETLPRYFRRSFIGADDGQQVHPRHGARISDIEPVLQQKYQPYRLHRLGRNFRNTFETYAFARQFMPKTNLVAWDQNILDQLEHAGKRGPKPIVISYSDRAKRDQHLETTLRNAEGNVAILCPIGAQGKSRNSGESAEEMSAFVSRLGLPRSFYYNEGNQIPNTVENYHVSTFKSAKGMEFDVVVIPRINFFKRIPEEWYVACTRAKSQLFIYRDLGNPQRDPIASFKADTYDAESLDAPAAGLGEVQLF